MRNYNAIIYRFMGLSMFFMIIFSFGTYGQQLSFEQLKKVRKKAAEASAFLDKSVIIAAIVTNDLNTLTATQLAESLVGEGVSVSNATFTGANVAGGSFSDGLSNGIGIEGGVVLSSGDISFVNGPNMSDEFTIINNTFGDSDLDMLVGDFTCDAAVLEFDFIPTGNTLSFQYVFASEEYNEYVDSSFNDVFGFFVDGVNIALIPSTTTPVAINNINMLRNSAYYNNNDPSDLGTPTPYDNLQYDGFTTVLTAQVTVTPNITHHMKLAIADTADEVFDSTVFISGKSLVSGDLPSATTNDPTDVTCDSAVLRGTVNPNGLATTVWFIYRTSIGLPITTSVQSVGGGISDIIASANIGGLLPGNEYFYKVVAQNGEGINVGSEIHFQTLFDGCETPTPTPTPTICPCPDAQACYSLDEGSGDTAGDSSGNGNDGTINGAGWTTGKNGSGLSFDGVDDEVSIPTMNSEEVSFGAWFYKNANDTKGYDFIFDGLRMHSNPQLREGFGLKFLKKTPDAIAFTLVTQDASGNRRQRTALYNMGNSVGGWNHVTGTYNKTTGEQKLYVNGQLVRMVRHPAGNSIVPLTSYPGMKIGNSLSKKGCFNGVIDGVCISHRALTEQEVLDIYNN
ncbi:MAG: LamG domain-containing protein [Candidatus Brocadia sp.]|nr:hypothetical protein [Candidatus Brocadia fulgida]MDG5995800.1 LamG domain-containing protein [Candidatus Brocadia sp.]